MRVFIVLLMALAPMVSMAQDKAHVVEFAVFSCPHCFELDGAASQLRNDLGDRFVFAPVVTSTTGDYAGRVYYGLRDKVDTDVLRQNLFTLRREMRFQPKSINEVLEFLRMQGVSLSGIDPKQAVRSDETLSAMRRTVSLARDAKINRVPAMVVIRNNQIDSVHRINKGADVGTLVRSVRKALRRGK